jgi:hypothetical protein
MCWRVPTEAAWGLTIGIPWTDYQLSGTQILDPIQHKNKFTMTEHPKLEWVTPKILLFDSEDTERGKIEIAIEDNNGKGPS